MLATTGQQRHSNVERNGSKSLCYLQPPFDTGKDSRQKHMATETDGNHVRGSCTVLPTREGQHGTFERGAVLAIIQIILSI